MKLRHVTNVFRRFLDREERGAVLALVGATLTIVLISGALAIDISALENRGQTLQNTADAAALAGVAVWEETGDMTAATNLINDVIAQNGLTPADGIAWTISFPNSNEVVVDIVDNEPEVFLGGVVGFGSAVNRDSTARHETCEAPCGSVIDIPPPFTAIQAASDGDGFRPIAVGDEFYAVNHHGDTMACVNRTTQNNCWATTNVDAFPGSVDAETGILSYEAVVGTRIYYTGQEATQIRLFCWETLTDSPCPTAFPIANLESPVYEFTDDGDTYTRAFNSVYTNYRGGGVIGIGTQIFVFTDDHRIHCFDPTIPGRCPGYPAPGLQTGLGAAGMLPLDPAEHLSGSNIDRIYDPGENRIYHTLQVNGERPYNHPGWADPWDPTDDWDLGIHLQCFDLDDRAPCAGFTNTQLYASARKSQAGRLFFHRTGDGTPQGVCATGLGRGSITCRTLDGAPAPGLEANLAVLDNALPHSSRYGSRGVGVHMYHEPSNRVFIVSTRQESTDFCWDFDGGGSYCGSLYGRVGANETWDYGFAYEGNCIFALGHATLFWSFTVDMEPGCPGSSTSSRIFKCNCGDIERWPNPALAFEVGPGTPFPVLDIQLLDPEGNVVFPEGVDDWISMVDHPTGTLDLSGVDTSYDYLDINIVVEIDDAFPDPWLTGEPPQIILAVESTPHLTE